MNDLNSIVTRLVERTQEGKLKWSETVQPEEYATSVGVISIKISKSTSPFVAAFAKSTPYTLEILDEAGRIVESLDGNDPTISDRSQFEQLHSAARRSARDIDEILEKLNDALEF